VTVEETAAEAPNQTAVAEKDKPVRHTTAQQSEKHRLPPESGSRRSISGYSAPDTRQLGHPRQVLSGFGSRDKYVWCEINL
jgi:hypothetical protein